MFHKIGGDGEGEQREKPARRGGVPSPFRYGTLKGTSSIFLSHGGKKARGGFL